jgi:hypothetical protein
MWGTEICRDTLLAKLLELFIIMASVWYVLSSEAGGLVNFVTGYHVVSPGLFRFLSCIIRMDWWTGIAATELPPHVHLGHKLAGPLCAAI